MTRVLTAMLASALIFTAACGDDDPAGPQGGSGTVTASVDGTAFNGSLAVSAVYANQVLAFGAVQSSGSTVRQFTFSLFPVTETGTFNVGLTSGYNFTYTEGSSSSAPTWTTQLPAASGTITLTTFTSSRAVGSFSVTMAPAASTGANGNKTVTGNFDVNF